MADIQQILPDFDIRPYSHLLFSLEKNAISVDDLCTRDPKDIAAACPLPLRDVQSLVKDVIRQLQSDVMRSTKKRKATDNVIQEAANNAIQSRKAAKVTRKDDMISTLDPIIDEGLKGGFRPGSVIDLVGEAGTGKTQLAMSLLLAVQLPPPKGLGRAAIYISTETPLNTTRLHQLLLHQPAYDGLKPEERPSLDRVYAQMAKDLEEQDHIIRYQLPIAVQRYNVGLVVLDSVSANFRAEHGTATAAQLSTRAAELTNLGTILRRLAVEHQICVFTLNQVGDRFDNARSSSPATTSSPAMSKKNLSPAIAERRQETQSLDHQQRFFTGWGDDKTNRHEQLKTPALGLAWANAISARLVLKMESEQQEYAGGNIWKDKKRNRFLSVVFAPWAPPTNSPIRYEITMQGLVSVPEPDKQKEAVGEEYADLLDEALWPSDEEDEEFKFP